MKNKQIKINDDFEAVLVCSVRYSLGRQTYMPSLIINYITPLIPDLSNNTLVVMKRDVDEWLRTSENLFISKLVSNDSLSVDDWVLFQSALTYELNKRDDSEI